MVRSIVGQVSQCFLMPKPEGLAAKPFGNLKVATVITSSQALGDPSKFAKRKTQLGGYVLIKNWWLSVCDDNNNGSEHLKAVGCEG